MQRKFTSVESMTGWNAETQSIRVDKKLLAHCSLADSATDASRKLKSNAVGHQRGVAFRPMAAPGGICPPMFPIGVGKRAKIAVIEYYFFF